jgi:hypothetical protein
VFSQWWWDVEDDFEERAREEPNESGNGMEMSWGGSSLAFVIGFEAYEALEREMEAERRLEETIAWVTSWLAEENGEMNDAPWEGVHEDEDWDLISTGLDESGSTGGFSEWEEVLEV